MEYGGGFRFVGTGVCRIRNFSGGSEPSVSKVDFVDWPDQLLALSCTRTCSVSSSEESESSRLRYCGVGVVHSDFGADLRVCREACYCLSSQSHAYASSEPGTQSYYRVVE
jgi:hypothetical protein